MKRSFWLAADGLVAISRPAWAQQDDVARLRAELANQQAIIGQLIKRLDDLEKKAGAVTTNEELKEEAKTQQEAVESVRETLLSRVNLNGYYNFRFSADESPTPVRLPAASSRPAPGKAARAIQLPDGARAPERARITLRSAGTGGTGGRGAFGRRASGRRDGTDVSGEGQVAVENAWMEYTHNRYLNVRVGKQLSPAVLVAEPLPEPDATRPTQPIYLRELFPAGAGRRHGARNRGAAVGAVGDRPSSTRSTSPTTSSKATARRTCVMRSRGAAGCSCGSRPADG